MMADLKVCYIIIYVCSVTQCLNWKNKLEFQYAAKREAQLNEVSDLKQQLEIRNNEVRSLNASIDSLKSVNEELKVRVIRAAVQSLILIPLSAHLLLLPLGLKAVKTLQKAPKILSGHERLSMFNWRNSMGLRNLSCVICRIDAKRLCHSKL